MTQGIIILGVIILFILLLLALKYKWIEDAGKIVGGTMAVIFIILGLALLFSLPVMWLWDYTMPYLFKVPEITLGRAFCLVILCQILFGSSSSSKKD
ncbi:MAG: hypothetical protein Q8O88_03975 [bacterium]|nr:hypothetical protein [bacterium]